MDYVNCPEHKIPQITNDKKTNKQNSQNKKKTIKKNNKMKKNTNLNQHFKITFKKKKNLLEHHFSETAFLLL